MKLECFASYCVHQPSIFILILEKSGGRKYAACCNQHDYVKSWYKAIQEHGDSFIGIHPYENTDQVKQISLDEYLTSEVVEG